VDFVAEADSDEWSTMMELNVVSVQRMVKAFLPALRKAVLHGEWQTS
jgi:NADP-dependent 3-hydroxy acid dehydrogenase YdfG